MATDRSLSVLKLFTLDRPVWTAEEIAKTLDVSMSTAYRYVLALEDVGLVATASAGRYILGPAIIQLDRQIQLTDPLLRTARPVMDKIAPLRAGQLGGPAVPVVWRDRPVHAPGAHEGTPVDHQLRTRQADADAQGRIVTHHPGAPASPSPQEDV